MQMHPLAFAALLVAVATAQAQTSSSPTTGNPTTTALPEVKVTDEANSAATEGSGRALTAEIVPKERHGLAFGLYNTAIAITALPASVIAGWLWDKYSPAAAFNFGWITAVAAILLFAVYSYRIRRRNV